MRYLVVAPRTKREGWEVLRGTETHWSHLEQKGGLGGVGRY